MGTTNPSTYEKQQYTNSLFSHVFKTDVGSYIPLNKTTKKMIKNIVVKPDITIRQAMKKYSQADRKCLIITDDKNNLLGTLSDGDLRRVILNGVSISFPVKDIFNKKPTVLLKGEYSVEEAKKLFTLNKFDLIPVVNEDGKLEDILL